MFVYGLHFPFCVDCSVCVSLCIDGIDSCTIPVHGISFSIIALPVHRSYVKYYLKTTCHSVARMGLFLLTSEILECTLYEGILNAKPLDCLACVYTDVVNFTCTCLCAHCKELFQ